MKQTMKSLCKVLVVFSETLHTWISWTIASITWTTSRAFIFGRFLEIFKLNKDLFRATPLTTLANSTSRLFSDTSSLETHVTPGRAFSMTPAPREPRLLLEMLSSTSDVDSLQARPRRRCFKASIGSLQCDRLRYFKPRVVAKNCLKVGGISPEK